MTGRISYMGTKHELAPRVRAVIDQCQPGRLLDAFAGMGAVAESLAETRQIWTNDVQHFAYLSTSCRLADCNGPMSARSLSKISRPLFQQNLLHLREQNARALRHERLALRASDFQTFQKSFKKASIFAPEHKEAYGCFVKAYSHGYFSLEQAAEIDSIRYALDNLRGRGTITPKQFNWALLALGAAILRLANTTGHFAQFLTPSAANYKRVLKQFQRNVWKEWLSSVTRVIPAGTSVWRAGNFATRSNSTNLLASREYADSVSVVYCDPPYTDDQYSRYYHIWETLVLYDYPIVTGRGRYRPDRFTTDFSLSSKVASAFENLISDVAATGADLIISYPSNGLLHTAGSCPLDMLKQAYPGAILAAEIDHSHSTMGASKGPAKAPVKERIYLARA